MTLKWHYINMCDKIDIFQLFYMVFGSFDYDCTLVCFYLDVKLVSVKTKNKGFKPIKIIGKLKGMSCQYKLSGILK
jgi:hypothetical protein